MIDEKKLLCAFIYSAYESGYCGLLLDRSTREEHKELYKKYIKDEVYYPQSEIESTQKKMVDSVDNLGIRDYIYSGHFEIVKKRIGEETGMDFNESINNKLIMHVALECPVNLYKILDVKDNLVTGENLFLPVKKELILMEGLEKPSLGDIVSGHWDHFLEVVNDLGDLEKYKEINKNYIQTIRESRK